MSKQLIIVGIGRTGRALVKVMPEDWSIVAIDINEERLAALPETHGNRPLKRIRGDAANPLVLEESGVNEHAALVITTRSDKLNIEIAKLARARFHVGQLVCMLHEHADLSAHGIKDFEILERSPSFADMVFNRICTLENRAVGLGLGQGEILETRILDGSAAAGQPLKSLKPQRWLVAAVYREGNLIVPHGDTVMQAEDRVLLVGEPEVLRNVGQFLRGGEPVFPKQFGNNLGVCGGLQTREEAEWLEEAIVSDAVVTVDRAVLDFDARSTRSIAAELVKQNVGCLLIDPQDVPWPARVGLTVNNRKQIMLEARIPVLVARGNFPYRKMLVAVSNVQQLRMVVHIAIDLARQCSADMTVLTVLPPSLAEGSEQLEPLREIPDRVASIGRLYDVKVETRHDEGNPIERIRHHARDFDLLVIGHSRGARNTFFTPDVSLFLLHDAPCSTLFVPWTVSGR